MKVLVITQEKNGNVVSMDDFNAYSKDIWVKEIRQAHDLLIKHNLDSISGRFKAWGETENEKEMYFTIEKKK